MRCLNCDVETGILALKCIECDACADICPTSCITFTPNADEPSLRQMTKVPQRSVGYFANCVRLMKNPLEDPLIRKALDDMDRLKKNPAYHAWLQHEEMLRRNPGYKAILDDIERRARDPRSRAMEEEIERLNKNPLHRALMQEAEQLRSNPAYRALREFESRHDKYSLRPWESPDIPPRTELWINKELLTSPKRLDDFKDSLRATDDIREVKQLQIDPEKPGADPTSAAGIVETINRDYSEALKQLSDDEELFMYVVAGGKEYQITDLVAEEQSNRIKAFLNGGDTGLFIFFAPFEMKVLFGKRKTKQEALLRSKVSFLQYKRGVGKQDRIRTFGPAGKKRMTKLSVIRVVVGSPNDVATERNHLQEIVDELNRTVADSRGVQIKLVRWETDTHPGFHVDGPQAFIDPILKIEEAQLFIGIFWKSFGTTLPSGETGTEHEFNKAYESWKATNEPQIMFYFSEQPYTPKSVKETDQWGRVLAFKENFPVEGLWWSYKDERDFERKVREHLTRFILAYAENEEEEEENNGDALVSEESTKIGSNKHLRFPIDMAEGDGIRFEIDATEPVDIAILGPDDYMGWRNGDVIDSYYEIYEAKTYLTGEFWAPEANQYQLLICNTSDEKLKVSVDVEAILDEA